jgi:LmbE family N-acetylglucosaminyl deacetylase
MKALFLVAHPDDEVLAFGETIRKLSTGGHDVAIAILGEGITSRLASRDETDPKTLEALDSNARKAANILGVRHLIRRFLPDNRFDSLALLDVIKVVEEILEETDPEVVYSHPPGT